MTPPVRYPAQALRAFAAALLERRGLASDRAEAVAGILVEGDLMGHTTHGLQLLGPYLGALESGVMTAHGEPTVIADRGGALTWDGRFLPGPWLVLRAMDEAFARIAGQGVVTVVIRRAHHIACLQAYLPRATERGLVMLLMSSDPATGSVAPHGGIAGRYTPNPIAAGFPAGDFPVLIDISASTTTNGLVTRLNREGAGRRLPGPWLVDNQGNPTDDPAVFQATPPGAILPLGGIDLGHKGFALGLLVEALTSALGGHGRADGETRWGAAVFLQVIDPDAFGGRAAFEREAAWLAQACRTTPVRPGSPPVRTPGERGMKRRAEQLARGIELHPEIMPSLQPWAAKLGVPLP
jgi:LDH2 family malate/lactate/ureidoglycolate dehydrogenase